MSPHELVAMQRNAWAAAPYPAFRERQAAIRRIRDWVRAHTQDIRDALAADLGKPEPESDLTETLTVLTEAKHTLRHLRRWMKPRRAGTPLALFGTRSRVILEPKGVCLIISPWNFPFNLAVVPLISALAAGNRCVMKPSELAPATSALVARLAAELFDPEQVAVVEGAADTAEALLAEPFDHIFFTGSGRVGRIVMEAASRNLSSVTLELGGKSPAIVDRTASVQTAAERIVWAKYLNAGQTCIAPDYVLVAEEVYEAFVREAEAAVERYLADGSPSGLDGAYARIITERHAQRLADLLDSAVRGGARAIRPRAEIDDRRFFEPVILTGVDPDAEVMQEEIFGPLLPVVPVADRSEAFSSVRARPRPLALYLFTTDRAAEREARVETSAGGMCVNDGLLHYLNPELPFGGVGASGSGKAHGERGFRELSNEKPVLTQRRGVAVTRLVYPPYTEAVRRRVRWMVDLLG